MQHVDNNSKSRQSKGDRYQRGIKNPKPAVMAKIREALEADPSVSKSKLAKLVGCSRQTILYYLRAMKDQVQQTASLKTEVRQRVAISILDLSDQVTEAIEDIKTEISRLRSSIPSPATASIMFRGYSTLEKLWRLLGELLGQIQPPQQNTYIIQVQELLNRTVDLAVLSQTAQKVLCGGNNDDKPL
jgi:hypothetical protein